MKKIELKQKERVWFIADCHFGHASILYFHPSRREACGLSYEELKEDKTLSVEKHDQWLINKWNTTIGKRDTVYILGDFCLSNKEYTEKILRQLNGKKFFIRGNHDKSIKGLENYFQWVGDIKEAKFSHQQFDFIDEKETFCIEMCHYPLVTWNRRTHGTCMVHGHVHSVLDEINKTSKELRIDVGLDAKLANYGFISLEQLYGYFRTILTESGCTTFQEYAEKLMDEQGFRM